MLPYLHSVPVFFFLSVTVCSAQVTDEALKNHEARKAHTYRNWEQRPVFERIWPAPDILVDYLMKDNALNGYPEVPESKRCDDRFMSSLREAILDLPEPVKRQFQDHLVGIFTVSRLGTTGYTEILYDFEKNKQGFIVLDVDYLTKPANDWATWKESSPFRRQGAFRIHAAIEEQGTDNIKQAIQYILVHEIGHLMGAVHGAHPDWFSGGDPKDFAFSRISWIKQGDMVRSAFDDRFPLRKEIGYYRFEKSLLSSDQILETYRQWESTDYSSLYAATNMWDDFAETYVIYTHCLLQAKPWRIAVHKGGTLVCTYLTTLLGKKGKSKMEFMDAFFKVRQ